MSVIYSNVLITCYYQCLKAVFFSKNKVLGDSLDIGKTYLLYNEVFLWRSAQNFGKHLPLDETSHYICLGMLSSLPLGRCTFDGTPINGRILNRFLVNGDTLQHNSIVEYSCDSSYKLTGSKVLRCKDGQWNATTPSCKGIVLFTTNRKNKRTLNFESLKEE